METKKNPRKNVYRLTNLWFNLGLLLSLAAVITAFEWKSVYDGPQIALEYTFEGEEMSIVPQTVIPPPPKPKPLLANPIPVQEDEPIEDQIEDIVFDPGELDVPEPIIEGDLPDETVVDYVDYADKQPEPIGGYEAFYKFISKNIKYPSQARKLGVEGKVFVRFIVDEQGEVTNLKIIRGIDAGCDAEVLRLMEKSPKWNPGKQRAKPVKVRMVIPIIFELKN